MLEQFRILVVVVLLMHGVSHVAWFLASWTSVRVGIEDGRWGLPGNITIRSPLGKAWGIGALVVMALFVDGALALLLQDPSWARITNLGIFLSFGVVVPWWRQAPLSFGITAVGVDIILMFLLALPLGEALAGPY